MADETKNPAAQADEPVEVVAAVVGDESGVQAAGAIAVEGDYAVLVAQFADMDSATVAYEALRDAEYRRAIDIEGVLVVNADYQGKIHIQKMTDHRSRNGFIWGAVAGAALAIIFPPTLLAGAVVGGAAGLALGKAGNLLKKGQVAAELASVITPGTSGIVALVALTAVDAVTQTIPQAKAVKSVPVDNETADAVKEAAKAAGDQPAS
jgi:uncharacterized membrane protein